MAELLGTVAVGFGTLALVAPALAARGWRRAAAQLRTAVRNGSYRTVELEPPVRQVRLTRLLGGWGVLLGVAATRPPTVEFWMVAGGYAVASTVGFGYAFVRGDSSRPEPAAGQ